MDFIIFKEEFNKLIHTFKNAPNFETQNDSFIALNKKRLEYEGKNNLLRKNHFIDLNNAEAQVRYSDFQKSEPMYLSMVNVFYEAILEATFRNELEQMWGEQIFSLAKIKIQTFFNKTNFFCF